MNKPLIIISAQLTPDVLSVAEQAAVDLLRARGFDCLLIPHLYHLGESSSLWKTLAKRATTHSVLLCWLHPRPAQWVLSRHGIGHDGLTVLNIGSFTDAAAVAAAAIAATCDLAVAAGKDSSRGTTETIAEPTQPRWYPIIDGSRCVNCQHCLQFCLFGVYSQDAQGQVIVHNPDQCKPGCPACARICPQSAIMFPLYERDVAIAGAPGQFVVLDAAARRMFYARSRQPCPVCGEKADAKPRAAAAGGTLCAECGGHQPAQPLAGAAARSAEPPPFDDLDDLVDRLEQQMQERRPTAHE